MKRVELEERVASLERELGLIWWCYHEWEDKVKEFGTRLTDVISNAVSEHIQDETSHHYGRWQTDKLKELEGNLQGLTKTLYEKIEEVMAKKKEKDVI